jgi:hypothetical protein
VKPTEAAAKLKAIPRALETDHGLLLRPASTLAFDAAKSSASGRPTPQAPAVSRSWSLSARGDAEVIAVGPTVAFSSGARPSSAVAGPALFGSNRAPQFHRAHRRPSWAWDAMDSAMASDRLDRTLQTALDRLT